MRENKHHYFEGRGKGSGVHPDPYRIIECRAGSVLAIIHTCHEVEFVVAYCRRALWDQWGLYCHAPFRRASDASLTLTWAEPMKQELFLFCPTRLEIEKEQDWMRHGR